MSKYNVGYCKPPENSQFPKGKSGNPAGRPKGSKSSKLLQKSSSSSRSPSPRTANR